MGVLKSMAEERGDILGTCFSLTHGTAFSLYAARILRTLEDEDTSVTVRHPGPVTLGSLKQHAAVFPFLADDNVDGWVEYQFPGFSREDVVGVGEERI